MDEIKLKDISEITSGLVISRKKALMPKDRVCKYKQLNLRSINDNGYIELDQLEILDAKEQIDESYLTHEGDIIMRLTAPFTAIYIKKDYKNLIISSNFCIIRKVKDYSPILLAYYLNSDTCKKMLVSNLQGFIVKNVNNSAIEEITIPKINLDQQTIFAKLLVAQTNKIINLDKTKKMEEKLKKVIVDKIQNSEVK